jgi:hypothetical protein
MPEDDVRLDGDEVHAAYNNRNGGEVPRRFRMPI